MHSSNATIHCHRTTSVGADANAGAESTQPFTCTRAQGTPAFRCRDLDQHLEVLWLLEDNVAVAADDGGNSVAVAGPSSGPVSGGASLSGSSRSESGITIPFLRGSHKHVRHDQQASKYSKYSSLNHSTSIGDNDDDDDDENGCGYNVLLHVQKGDVVVFTGDTQHTLPTSALPSAWLSASYHCAYLSQRENQFLGCPPEKAVQLPPHVARLIGYCKPGQVLNKLYCGGTCLRLGFLCRFITSAVRCIVLFPSVLIFGSPIHALNYFTKTFFSPILVVCCCDCFDCCSFFDCGCASTINKAPHMKYWEHTKRTGGSISIGLGAYMTYMDADAFPSFCCGSCDCTYTPY